MSNTHIDNALDWQHGDAEPSAFALQNAQIEATLALAYEQRTANLLAYLQPVQCADGSSASITVAAVTEVLNEVSKRLDRPNVSGTK